MFMFDEPLDLSRPTSRRRKADSSDCEDGKEDEMDVMDERTAALVLTSLSCSPVSPHLPASFPGERDVLSQRHGIPLSSSFGGSSGISLEPHTPSPPQHGHHHSCSAPGASTMAAIFGTIPIDEGIDMDESTTFDETNAKRQRTTMDTVFKCTWPGCSKVFNTCPTVEQHVRDVHLGPKDVDSDLSDHEEEFYYTEMEVTIDAVTETFADMYTSSPPTAPNFMNCHLQSHSQPPFDHDYSNKPMRSAPQNIPTLGHHERDSIGVYENSSYPLSHPIAIQQHPRSRSFSWQPQVTSPSSSSPGRRQMGLIVTKQFIPGSSPKGSPMHKKGRSEVKKCRKVYGMESREMWCTQCKWKKACTRFIE